MAKFFPSFQELKGSKKSFFQTLIKLFCAVPGIVGVGGGKSEL
jgi:hypothetical protein